MLAPAPRRLLVALAVTLVPVVGFVSAPPAGAATKTVSYDAIGSWLIDGPTTSNVSLQVTKTEGADATIFFFVSQQFCDTANNQEVFRSFSGSQPAQRVLFDIGVYLSSAVIGARRVPMSGTEQRIDGCTTGANRAVHTHSLASFKASIYGSWTATSPGVKIQPGIHGRDGTAYGVELSGGPLNLGDIGASDFAQLRKNRLPTP
jgi:hypothetical protein